MSLNQFASNAFNSANLTFRFSVYFNVVNSNILTYEVTGNKSRLKVVKTLSLESDIVPLAFLQVHDLEFTSDPSGYP